MKRGINLKLPKKKPSQTGRRAFLYSTIILLLTFAVGVALIGYSFFLQASLDGLLHDKKGLADQILRQNTKYYKLQDTHARLKNIQEVLSGRLKAIDKVDNIANIIPDNTKVLSITSESLNIVYSITSPDLSEINSLLEEKLLQLAAEKDKNVKVVELSSLVFDPEDSLYRLTFKVKF